MKQSQKYGVTGSELVHATPPTWEMGGAELDAMFVQACETWEKESELLQPKRDRFAHPKTDSEVSKARRASIPKKTQLDTNYCTRIWNEWRLHPNSTTTTDTVPALSTLMQPHF